MLKSTRISRLKDEANALIEKQVTSEDAEFITWRTKVSRFLKEEFGEESQEYREFDSRQFYKHSFSLTSEPTHQEHVWVCRTNMKEVTAELDAYLALALDDEADSEEDNTPVSTPKEKMILISHSTADKPIVEKFVGLLEAVGCREDVIICSSIPPYCIPLGNNIYKWLIDKFQNYDLYVIYLLSQNYYSSAACLNEMGAAWAMHHKWNAILLPHFDFAQISGCIDAAQISIKLDDNDKSTLNYRLRELADDIIAEFGLRAMNSSYWERKRDEFINDISAIQKQIDETHVNANAIAVSADATEDSVDFSDVVLLSLAINECRLEYYSSITGVSVSAGSFKDADLSAREIARWNDVIENLCANGYIKQTSDRYKIFSLTNKGYEFCDKLKARIGVTTKEELEQYLTDNDYH